LFVLVRLILPVVEPVGAGEPPAYVVFGNTGSGIPKNCRVNATATSDRISHSAVGPAASLPMLLLLRRLANVDRLISKPEYKTNKRPFPKVD